MIPSILANNVEPSRGRYLFNLASKYDDVINLTLGDPDICSPISIKNAACDSIMQNKTRYSANAGLYSLRSVYSKYINERYGKEFKPEEQVIVTVGGMEALYLAMISSLNPGDEVILFEPYYINYYQMIIMCGAIPIVIKTEEKENFTPKIKTIKNVITSRTKMIVINSPSNPTGAVYSKEIIDGVLMLAKERNILIISDEVYSTLTYEEKHYSVLESDINYDDIIAVNSCSKMFSMTGWRVGFAVGPKEWIGSMVKLQENVAACAPLPSQYAAIEAFNNIPDMSYYIKEFQERRDLLINKLSTAKSLKFNIPMGTFYLFINITDTGMNGMEFALKLLDTKHVAVVPGIAYGNNFDNYIRVAFTLEKKLLSEAAERIVSLV